MRTVRRRGERIGMRRGKKSERHKDNTVPIQKDGVGDADIVREGVFG